MFVCFSCCFFLGCTEDDTEERLFSLEKFYADSSFLEIQGDLNDPHVIWGNVKTYLPAFERMKRYLYVKDNRLCWDVVSGAELNISANIYDYIVERWKRMNRQVEEGKGTLKLCNNHYRIIYEDVDASRVFENTYEERSLPSLKQGSHEWNMRVLFELTWRVYKYHCCENLKNHIDIKNSEFIGDGVGGVNIYGDVTVGDDFCGYFCCNACAFMEGDKKYDCEFNNIISYDRILGVSPWYFQVENPQYLPLVSLRNADKFEFERGQILRDGE